MCRWNTPQQQNFIKVVIYKKLNICSTLSTSQNHKAIQAPSSCFVINLHGIIQVSFHIRGWKLKKQHFSSHTNAVNQHYHKMPFDPSCFCCTYCSFSKWSLTADILQRASRFWRLFQMSDILITLNARNVGHGRDTDKVDHEALPWSIIWRARSERAPK